MDSTPQISHISPSHVSDVVEFDEVGFYSSTTGKEGH